MSKKKHLWFKSVDGNQKLPKVQSEDRKEWKDRQYCAFEILGNGKYEFDTLISGKLSKLNKMDKGVISEMIGKEIVELRIMSFFIKLKLVCEIIALYLKTNDNKWYRLTVSDGFSKIETINDEPVVISVNSVKDEFAYPIKVFQYNQPYGRVIHVSEYCWQGKKDESMGLYIKMENNDGISLIEKDDCLFVMSGILTDANYQLI